MTQLIDQIRKNVINGEIKYYAQIENNMEGTSNSCIEEVKTDSNEVISKFKWKDEFKAILIETIVGEMHRLAIIFSKQEANYLLENWEPQIKKTLEERKWSNEKISNMQKISIKEDEEMIFESLDLNMRENIEPTISDESLYSINRK